MKLSGTSLTHRIEQRQAVVEAARHEGAARCKHGVDARKRRPALAPTQTPAPEVGMAATGSDSDMIIAAIGDEVRLLNEDSEHGVWLCWKRR